MNSQSQSRFNLAPCDEVAAAPSSTSFVMRGNESYGVPLHANNSGKLKCDEAVSAPSSTAFAMGEMSLMESLFTLTIRVNSSQLTAMKQYLHHPPLHLLVCPNPQAQLHLLFSLLVLTMKIAPYPTLPSVMIWVGTAELSLCCLCYCWYCCWLWLLHV